MRRIDEKERRSRLGRRHLLASPGPDVESAAAALVGLHSSDPTTVYLSAWARTEGFTVEQLEDALYERRTLLRMLGMRRTMFVVPRDVAAVMDAACTRALADRERRRHISLIEQQGLAKDGAAWLAGVERRTLEALADRGEATAAELRTDVPELKKKLTFGEGKTWGGETGISTRVLFMLATDGKILRGRPRGSWISSQYRWAPVSTWIPGGLEVLPEAQAQAELCRRWLASFGPGTLNDLKWWTGWTVRTTRAALAAVAAIEVELAGAGSEVGYVLPDDDREVAEPAPWVALLPSLDPTSMGWKDRTWYFGDHAAQHFDRNGNAGPTVWVDGRVVGGWTQAPSGEVRLRLLEDLGRQARGAIEDRAGELEAWLGDTRITPRFRTPIDKQLSG
jgi:hypothetical protein